MDYKEILEAARKNMNTLCKSCPVCNGAACGNTIPGPGSKPPGNGAARNYKAWQDILVNMDTICGNETPDTSFELFGRRFPLPMFAAPIAGMKMHYGSKDYDDFSYNDLLISACAEAGLAAFVGDGVDPEIMKRSATASAAAGGLGIPTIKPWDRDTVLGKLDVLNASGVFAAAMDIDGAGLSFLKALNANAGSKTVEEMREIINYAKAPFIVKGIMTAKGALKAVEAGAAGIVVSNHGGRVQGQTPSTAEVLPEIVSAVKGRTVIFVDGGIRSGTDIFKALALGADAVLIGRPFVSMINGAGAEGVKFYIDRITAELRDTMTMCGAHSLAEITSEKIFLAQ